LVLNIQKLNERGEKLGQVELKTGKLADSSKNFADSVKVKLLCKYRHIMRNNPKRNGIRYKF
jgi:hypothetical protein